MTASWNSPSDMAKVMIDPEEPGNKIGYKDAGGRKNGMLQEMFPLLREYSVQHIHVGHEGSAA